jgi:hypothetical protein
MKLHEIIKLKHTTDQVERPSSQKDMVKHPHGLYSYVKFDDEQPHTARKYSRGAHASSTDPFDTYARVIMDNELWSKSVHFPRVYERNVSDDEKYGSSTDWTMEKLISDKELSDTDIKGLLKVYFTGRSVDLLLGANTFSRRQALRAMSQHFADMLEHPSDLSDEVLAVKPNQRQLLYTFAKLREIKDKHNLEADMHPGNIMYRRSGNGLQIVFNDPFG